MSYLDITTPILDAKLTNIGREKISKGNFNISYFQIGDSEFDYNFPNYSGGSSNHQKVLFAKDKDSSVKYPYLLTNIVNGTTTGTTLGNPIFMLETNTITAPIGYAGLNSGTTVQTHFETINLDSSHENIISVSDINNFKIGDFITIRYKPLNNNLIDTNTMSFVYEIIDIQNGKLYTDRKANNLAYGNLSASLIKNDYNDIDNYEIINDNPLGQQDAWNLNVVWGAKPIGLGNKSIYDYESNPYVSTKEYYGYTTSSGQLTNTGTTITDASKSKIIVSPEEQHSIAILHYSKNSETNVDKIFKYDDYINSNINSFEVYLPFMLYDRNTSNTIGAKFHMGFKDKYINSSAIDSWSNSIKYRDLVDEQGYNVGKIFVDDSVIIFDDQEIVAVLDNNSNRTYTLPIPKLEYVPTDLKCSPSGSAQYPLLSGNTTGKTYYVTYGFENTSLTAINSLPCNHYLKITGTTQHSDLSIKFYDGDFKYMKGAISNIDVGYVFNKFYIYFQEKNTNETPDPENWKKMDFTSEVGLNSHGYLEPTNLIKKFIITKDDETNSSIYSWVGADNFGKSQPFPGSVKLSRSTDIKIMKYHINLPNGEFCETQNPTYQSGVDKYITEVALLDDNFDMVVSGKLSTPLKREGSQIISLKLDI